MAIWNHLRTLVFAITALAGSILAVLTQASAAPVPAADKSWLVGWIESEISTPDRTITLGEVDGVLSSDVKVSTITVADRQGVWLTINGAHLIWNRSALLTGELSIDSLVATDIIVTRAPVSAPDVAAGKPLPAVPALPVSIRFGKLSVPNISLPASIVGADTNLALEGSGSYDNKTLRAKASMSRTGSIGGAIKVSADYVTATGNLDIDLDYHEPKGGVIARLLNIPGEPALAFGIKGSGQVANFGADISLSSDNTRLMSGKAIITHGASGYAFALDVAGSLETLAASAHDDFLRGGSSLSVHVAQVPDGGFVLSQLRFKSGALTLGGSGAFAGDGFPTALALTGAMDATSGQSLHLPGTSATLAGGAFRLDFGNGRWTTKLDARDFASNALTMVSLTVDGQGLATALQDPNARATTFAIRGSAAGLTSTDSALAKALESEIAFQLDGHWRAGQAIDISLAKVSNKTIAASFVGTVDRLKLSGDYKLSSSDLSTLSGLTGTALKGQADLVAKGDLNASTGAFAVDMSGEAQGIAAGPAIFAPLTTEKTALSGHVVRDVGGLHLRTVRLGNQHVRAELTGDLGTDATTITAKAALANIAIITDRASGPIDVSTTLVGPNSAMAFRADITSPDLVLQGQHWSEAAVRASGMLGSKTANADISLGGTLYGKPLVGRTHLDLLADGTRKVSGLDLGIGEAAIKADIAMTVTGLIAGSISADIPRMEQVAPLMLTKATGSLQLKADLNTANAQQNATISGHLNGVSVETLAIGYGAINLAVSDLYQIPAVNGLIDLKSLSVGSFSMTSANVRMQLAGRTTSFNATATTSEGPVATSGSLVPVVGGFDITIASLKTAIRGAAVTLKAPVTVSRRDQSITIRSATLLLPQSGSVTVDGVLGDMLALNLVATKIPVSLADAVSRGLGATGTLSGTVQVTGTRDAPQAKFSFHGDSLSVAAIRGAGLPALALAVTGEGDRTALRMNARLTGGPTSLTATGTIPYAGDGLDVTIKGTSSLTLANVLLRDRGATASGRIDADIRVSGSIAEPRPQGRITVAGGTINDPQTENQLSGLNAALRLDGTRITIERASATTGKSGTVSATGSLALSGDYAADLRVTLASASLADQELAKAIVSGTLTVTGPVLARPRIAGALTINRADISIPERFSSNVALLGVRDVRASTSVKRTNALATRATTRKARGAPAFDAVIDMTISAPSMIFVRGRGVNAELAGAVRLTGPLSKIVPTGSFRLTRGSIDVIGKHITLDRGDVTLTGNFDPTIDFVALAKTSSISVTAAITGEVSDPQLKLSSSPDLPQDEILAQFLFGHSIADLTPLQLVQLAGAAAQLAGGASGGDLLASLRSSTGLDTLGTTTDASGNIALQAGRNISEHVYLGITTGARGDTQGTINLDVTPNIKLTGQAGTSESKLGIGYQLDY